VRGTSDADAVFGLMYAQAEDDFNRIEVNYLNAMGRLAEAEGERAIWRELRMKLFEQPDSMQALYAAGAMQRRGVPQLPARVCRSPAQPDYSVRSGPGIGPAEGQARRADRGAAWLGLPLGGDLGAYDAGGSATAVSASAYRSPRRGGVC